MEQRGIELLNSALRTRDRVIGRHPTISSLKGSAAGKSSGFHIASHALQFTPRSVLGFLDTNWPHRKPNSLIHASLSY